MPSSEWRLAFQRLRANIAYRLLWPERDEVLWTWRRMMERTRQVWP